MTVRLIREASLDDIIREMSRMFHEGMADPSVKRLAQEAISGKPDPLAAIHNFVQNTFSYQADPDNYELFIHPRVIAEAYYQGKLRSFDCDDFSLLTAAMYGSLNYPSRILLVDSSGLGELDHALAQVETNVGWLNSDTTTKNPLGWVRNFGQTVVIE